MTNTQLYLAIGIPILFNTLISVMVYTLVSQRMTEGFAAVNLRITDMQVAFNKRLDDMTTAWRDALLRVEQVMDARLKHLEERRP